MTLEADEFIRRFLLHTLPPGFVRIRHYGLLAGRNKKRLLPLCAALLQNAAFGLPSAAEVDRYERRYSLRFFRAVRNAASGK